jgi:hypothetical protein
MGGWTEMAKVRLIDMLTMIERLTDVQLTALAEELARENRNRRQRALMSERAERNQPPLDMPSARQRVRQSRSRDQSLESGSPAPAPQ